MDIYKNLLKNLRNNVCLCPEHIGPDDRFKDDIGLDSIEHVEIIMRSEEDHDIDINEGQVDRNITVAEFAAMIMRLLGD